MHRAGAEVQSQEGRGNGTMLSSVLNTGVLERLGQDTGISVKADERSPSH